MLLDRTPYILYPNLQTTFLLYLIPLPPSSLLPPIFPLVCRHLQTTYLLMMCCKRLLLCFSHPTLHLPSSPLSPPLPHPPAPTRPPLPNPWLHLPWPPSRWNLSGFNWPVSIKFWKHKNSQGTCKWSSLQPSYLRFLLLHPWTPGPRQELMSLASPLQPNLPFHYIAISFSPCSRYLSLPYPFLPPLLNRSPRQWLSQARPPSWDQEEANAFLMRPRPQCDTVKWQESVAGEPLVQGIYHLKPSDPLCLWDGGRKREVNREWGRQAEVEEERESYGKAG